MITRITCATSARTRRRRTGFGLLAGALGLMFASAAQANPVDCDNGGVIGPLAGDPLVKFVQFVGICNESLTINRDDFTLDGGGTGIIQGTLHVRGDRIQLSNMTIRGSGGGTGVRVEGGPVFIDTTTIENFRDGANVSNSAAVSFIGTTIKDNTNNGIFAQSSSVTVVNGSIRDNANSGISTRAANIQMINSTIERNARFGLLVTENSSVRVSGGKIEIDVAIGTGGQAAIGVFRQSLVRLLGTLHVENINVGGRAINLGQQAWLRQSGGIATIESPNEAIRVSAQSGADLRAFGVEGDIDARHQSFLNLRNGTVEGSVRLQRDSDVLFSDSGGPVAVNGDLLCNDDDSKATLEAGTVVSGVNDCAGFTKTP